MRRSFTAHILAMVDFHDPVELARDYNAVINLMAISNGVYIWEFLATLGYEWDVIQGRRPYRWTIWLYSLCRLSTLMSAVANLITVNLTTRMNCQALISFDFIFPNFSFSFASLLMLVRISAIWNMNKPAVALASGVWVTNVAFLIMGAARMRSKWVPALHACGTFNAEANKPTVIATLFTDIALILIMLVGLLRLRRHGGGWLDLGHLLWKQGIVWLSLATVTELIPVVFMCLNLNVAFDVMFTVPTVVTMTIAATRMYRSLSDFSSNTDVSKNSKHFRRAHHSARRANLAINSQSRVEVTVHTTHEQYVTSPTSKRQSASFVRMEHLRDKTDDLSLHESAESNV